MKVVLTEPRFLKDSINILSELVSDVSIKFDSDKLEIVAMDPANVAMVVFRLLSSSFVEYNVEGVETISISLASLKQVLGRARPSDSITLELDNDKNRLNVKLRGESVRDFNLGLIDIQDNEQKVPELEFPVKVTMNSVSFNEAVEDMDIISDSIGFIADQNKLQVFASGTTSDARVEFGKTDETLITVGEEGEIKSKYSTEYLKKIIKGSKLSDVVNLQFGEDYPLQIEYKVTDRLQLFTILAPRVENK
ncbi:proliferating cell nuclear antigen (pcna) [archaeon]|jgi:proliferating cell nuclear antigen|nr:proliferating cell nuclear antigen (pcna) [archaeon]